MAGPGDEAAAGCGHLRASHADREQAIEWLKTAFVQGRPAKDEFDTRVGQAFASRTYAELATVTADRPGRGSAVGTCPGAGLADDETGGRVQRRELGSGAKGTRTPDPLLAKQVLFQLSYSPERGAPRVPGARPGTRSPAAAPAVRPVRRALRRAPQATSSAGAAASGRPPASVVGAWRSPAAGASVPAPATSAGNSVIRVMKWVAPASRNRSRV